MHPAKSVIFFTTASGAGYGMLIWLAVFAGLGWLPAGQLFGFIAFAIAFILVAGGLLSSTFHLGHPERAWRAMSQWKTSWLSREGLIAVLTFIPTGLFAAGWVFLGRNDGALLMLGAAGALMSLMTVYCTAMIYASLKAIPAWSNVWTPPAYLVLSLATGAVLVTFISAVFGLDTVQPMIVTALIALAAALAIKLAYWSARSGAAPVSTSASATGMDRFGKVTLIEAPHSESNYLMEEMGFRIARKHASKLRAYAIGLGFLLPLALLAAVGWTQLPMPEIWLGVAVLSCAFGIIAERWLFFAEARHVVTLYYGETSA
ncbi:DmsC/YnfH family molybdoenzyme membrane anchor subunit [Hyphobacterium sp. HN65]|uniref:DmsC/YnfH family molybdoenzyme membrane anchor subunit n=1 Tax=Hyphobacterium lacteum TaxID=3116575 RepID=A0ABU7LPC5_9PROT|nr:DmsC/YnfH family molybdoenzyme membrane anchor subunit [Hyphobacterium sp. HN65]MEE2525733.1 DmsC/YnfH family molybdoenzyme membrane anchor subunit [Hyphobacterium sp. HN65]